MNPSLAASAILEGILSWSTRVEHLTNSSSEIIDLSVESITVADYDNHPVANVNDHAVRISIMTEPFHWHFHPDSDETFLALEDGLFIDLENKQSSSHRDSSIPVRKKHSSSNKAGRKHVYQSHIRTGRAENTSISFPDLLRLSGLTALLEYMYIHI
jgi:hypothetical protein